MKSFFLCLSLCMSLLHLSAQNEFIPNDPYLKTSKKDKQKKKADENAKITPEETDDVEDEDSPTVQDLNHSNPNVTAVDMDFTTLEIKERKLMEIADTFLYHNIPEDRTVANEHFIPKLIDMLKEPNSYYNSLDSLSRKVNIIYPQDSSFRIFNWEVNHGNNVTRYYGAIQMPSEELKLFPMFDISSENFDRIEDTILQKSQWFGGLIYKIIDLTLPDNTKAYVTLSLNRNGQLSNKKIMDVLILKGGKPLQWGIPFIETPEGSRVSRYILEFNKNANVSMNWDNIRKMVYFDITRSEINNPSLKYTYIPIGDYSGYKWDGKFWRYVPQILDIVEYQEGSAPTDELTREDLFKIENEKKKKSKK